MCEDQKYQYKRIVDGGQIFILDTFNGVLRKQHLNPTNKYCCQAADLIVSAVPPRPLDGLWSDITKGIHQHQLTRAYEVTWRWFAGAIKTFDRPLCV